MSDAEALLGAGKLRLEAGDCLSATKRSELESPAATQRANALSRSCRFGGVDVSGPLSLENVRQGVTSPTFVREGFARFYSSSETTMNCGASAKPMNWPMMP